MIIIIELINFYLPKSRGNNNNLINEDLLQIDNIYINIKYYEIYRLLYYKINAWRISNLNNSYNFNELFGFIKSKYFEYRKSILNNKIEDENYHQQILAIKYNIMNENNGNNIYFYNRDYAYSPYLLDDYCIASISKLVLSPYY